MNDMSEFQGESSIIDPDDNIQPEVIDPRDLNITSSDISSLEVEDFASQQLEEISAQRSLDKERVEQALEMIDGELVRLGAREVLPANEVTDLLLDLRLQLVGTAEDSE